MGLRSDSGKIPGLIMNLLKINTRPCITLPEKKSALVSHVLSSTPLNISFRRSLVANNLLLWHQLVARVMGIQLQDQSDTFVWSLHQNGFFSVRSMYRAITTTNIIPHNHIIWKLKLPLKIKIFMWYLIKRVTLTKDNLARRRWKWSLKCCYCNLDETIQHLFFIATMLNSYGD